MSMVAYFSFWCPFNNPHEAIVSNLDSWSSCGPRLFQLESVGEESQCQACVGTMGILHNESETDSCTTWSKRVICYHCAVNGCVLHALPYMNPRFGGMLLHDWSVARFRTHVSREITPQAWSLRASWGRCGTWQKTSSWGVGCASCKMAATLGVPTLLGRLTARASPSPCRT